MGEQSQELQMDVSGKPNGEISHDSSDEKRSPLERPQRRLRLNRRGFHLSSFQSNAKPPEKKSNWKPIVFHSSSTSEQHETKSNASSSSSERKIISLKNHAKNGLEKFGRNDLNKKSRSHHIEIDSNSSNAGSGTLRSVYVDKKNVTINVENVKSEETAPPKKKHKPITWP